MAERFQFVIRQETSKDYSEVYELIKTAFESAECSDGKEQDLAEALRKSNAFVPELSLVAECDGKIIGHVMFTKIYIGSACELALAPLSVLPRYQNKGVGSALIEEGHKIAKKLGFCYSIVLGHQGYYPKMGYVPAIQYGIQAPFDVASENFMAFRLLENARPVKGIVKYADEFGID